MKAGNETTTTVRSETAHMGWQELLPAGTHRRVLCLDVGDGHATLALAQMYEQVVSVPLLARDATAIADLVDRAGAHQVTVVPTLGSEVEGEFDGLVAVLFGSEHGGAGSSAAAALVREAAARIGEGFVLLGAANVLACTPRIPDLGRPGSRANCRRVGTWACAQLARVAER